MIDLVDACEQMPVPQQWIGSSVAIVLEKEKLEEKINDIKKDKVINRKSLE